MGGDKVKQLVFEDYLNLYRVISDKDHTSAHFNQAEITDAVEFLLLSPPVRSTTRTNTVPLVSLCTASLSLEEIREDMQTIGWEEFTVQSVVTVETAAPAILQVCRFSAPVSEKDGKRKEIEKESMSMHPLPAVQLRPPIHKSICVAAKNSKTADRYSWQKYDSRKRVDHPYRQRYYKCRQVGCCARKIIDRDANNPSILIITYVGEHNHPSPQPLI